MYLISWTLRNNCSSAWNSSFWILWWGHLLWNLGCCLDLQVCTHSICSFEARQFRWPNKQIQSLPPLRQIPEFFAISAVLSEVLGLANSLSPLETDCFEETAVHGSLIPYLSRQASYGTAVQDLQFEWTKLYFFARRCWFFLQSLLYSVVPNLQRFWTPVKVAGFFTSRSLWTEANACLQQVIDQKFASICSLQNRKMKLTLANETTVRGIQYSSSKQIRTNKTINLIT